MIIKFYHNASNKNVLDKTITLVKQDTIILKNNDFSLITPSLLIDDFTINSNINYCKIEELNRFYFIDDVTIKGQLLRLDLSIDVLMSYNNIIKLSHGIVKQSNNVINPYATSLPILDTLQTKNIIFSDVENKFTDKNMLYVVGVN